MFSINGHGVGVYHSIGVCTDIGWVLVSNVRDLDHIMNIGDLFHQRSARHKRFK